MSPGDKVSFINDNLKGTVKRIIDKKQVLLLLDDGFEIPANISELVVTDAPGDRNKVVALKDETIVPDIADRSDKLYFGAITEDTGKGQIVKAYLINTTLNLLQFSLFRSNEGRMKGIAHGEIEQSRALKIITFPMAEATEFRNLTVQYMYFNESAGSLMAPVQVGFRIKPVSLFKDRYMIPVLKEEGFLINITDFDPNLVKNEPIAARAMPKPVPVPDIIDLHLEELTEDWKTLPPQEALHLQMRTFHQALDRAIAQNLDNITFIHGVGKGILKDEVRKVLASNVYIQGFAEADTKKFGHGATIVYLKSR